MDIVLAKFALARCCCLVYSWVHLTALSISREQHFLVWSVRPVDGSGEAPVFESIASWGDVALVFDLQSRNVPAFP